MCCLGLFTSSNMTIKLRQKNQKGMNGSPTHTKKLLDSKLSARHILIMTDNQTAMIPAIVDKPITIITVPLRSVGIYYHLLFNITLNISVTIFGFFRP